MSGILREAIYALTCGATGGATADRLTDSIHGVAYRVMHVYVDDTLAAGTGNVVVTDELGNNLGVTDFTTTGTRLWTTDDLGGQHEGVLIKGPLTVTLDTWTAGDQVTVTVIFKDE